jgi:tetratricopeptide (TPR) repeat protein
VPLEDTIGIRSYTIQEINHKLRDNGLAFTNPDTVDNFSTELDQNFDHRIHVVKKIRSIKSTVKVTWAQLADPHYHSPLDLHLYETYAEDCAQLGKPQEGIQTLQSLVQRHPKHLSGWLRLIALLLEHGQIPQAFNALQELTALHPRYQEGHAALERLQNYFRSIQDTPVTT